MPVLDNVTAGPNVTVNLELFEPIGGATTNGTTVAAILTIQDNEPGVDTPAGSVNNGFGGETGPDERVLSVVHVSSITNTHPASALQNGRWLIGGDFTFIDGVPRNRIAVLDLDGSVETDNFDRITTGFNNSVNAIAVHTVLNSTNLAVDNNLLGSIVVGGAFTTYNGVNHSRVVRLNPDGSIDTSFNVGSGTDNPVFAIAIQNDNKIIIAGDFTEVNGVLQEIVSQDCGRTVWWTTLSIRAKVRTE